MPSEPWRYRCPHGHATVRRRDGQWWCSTCSSEPSKYPTGPWYDFARDAKTDMEVSSV